MGSWLFLALLVVGLLSVPLRMPFQTASALPLRVQVRYPCRALTIGLAIPPAVNYRLIPPAVNHRLMPPAI